ncbi:atherin-like [Gorilla gorilla gorilla]|uniref:atherin-like n=1 Tax=Gorilla gorilla gorilla TaxID=9595 RepID=UPI002445B6F7|nr:atherin-like [Gorilla gorilla gorilla]
MSSASPPGVAGRLHQTPRGAAARASSLAWPSRASRPSGARAGFPRAGPAPSRAAGVAAASSSPFSGRPPRPPYLLLQPACPQAASTPSGPARCGPSRPRPHSPRVSEEERRLRNRQPPPVPQPRPPASPTRRGRARRRRHPDQWERRPAGGTAFSRDGQPSRPIVGRLAAGGGPTVHGCEMISENKQRSSVT